MISCRQADLMDSPQDAETPEISAQFVITFPTANQGNEHAKKNGVYYAVPHLSVPLSISDPKNDIIVEKIESVVPGDFDADGDWYIYANTGETFDDFSKRLLHEYRQRLARITEEPPTYTMQSTGRYQWIIHLKIKPTKKL